MIQTVVQLQNLTSISEKQFKAVNHIKHNINFFEIIWPHTVNYEIILFICPILYLAYDSGKAIQSCITDRFSDFSMQDYTHEPVAYPDQQSVSYTGPQVAPWKPTKGR